MACLCCCGKVRQRYKIHVRAAVFDGRISGLVDYGQGFNRRLPQIGRYLFKQMRQQVFDEEKVRNGLEAFHQLTIECGDSLQFFDDHAYQAVELGFERGLATQYPPIVETTLELLAVLVETAHTHRVNSFPYKKLDPMFNRLMRFIYDWNGRIMDSQEVSEYGFKALSAMLRFCPKRQVIEKYEDVVHFVLPYIKDIHHESLLGLEDDEKTSSINAVQRWSRQCFETLCGFITDSNYSDFLDVIFAELSSNDFKWGPPSFTSILMDIIASQSQIDSTVLATEMARQVLHSPDYDSHQNRILMEIRMLDVITEFGSTITYDEDRSPVVRVLCDCFYRLNELQIVMDQSNNKFKQTVDHAEHVLQCIQQFVKGLLQLEYQPSIESTILPKLKKATTFHHKKFLLLAALHTVLSRKILSAHTSSDRFRTEILRCCVTTSFDQHRERDNKVELIRISHQIIQNILLPVREWTADKEYDFYVEQFEMALSTSTSPTFPDKTTTTEQQRMWIYAQIFVELQDELPPDIIQVFARTVGVLMFSQHTEGFDVLQVIPFLMRVQDVAVNDYNSNDYDRAQAQVLHGFVLSVLLMLARGLSKAPKIPKSTPAHTPHASSVDLPIIPGVEPCVALISHLEEIRRLRVEGGEQSPALNVDEHGLIRTGTASSVDLTEDRAGKPHATVTHLFEWEGILPLLARAVCSRDDGMEMHDILTLSVDSFDVSAITDDFHRDHRHPLSVQTFERTRLEHDATEERPSTYNENSLATTEDIDARALHDIAMNDGPLESLKEFEDVARQYMSSVKKPNDVEELVDQLIEAKGPPPMDMEPVQSMARRPGPFAQKLGPQLTPQPAVMIPHRPVVKTILELAMPEQTLLDAPRVTNLLLTDDLEYRLGLSELEFEKFLPGCELELEDVDVSGVDFEPDDIIDEQDNRNRRRHKFKIRMPKFKKPSAAPFSKIGQDLRTLLRHRNNRDEVEMDAFGTDEKALLDKSSSPHLEPAAPPRLMETVSTPNVQIGGHRNSQPELKRPSSNNIFELTSGGTSNYQSQSRVPSDSSDGYAGPVPQDYETNLLTKNNVNDESSDSSFSNTMGDDG